MHDLPGIAFRHSGAVARYVLLRTMRSQPAFAAPRPPCTVTIPFASGELTSGALGGGMGSVGARHAATPSRAVRRSARRAPGRRRAEVTTSRQAWTEP